jgi:hypothetical protein
MKDDLAIIVFWDEADFAVPSGSPSSPPPSSEK